MSPLRARGDAEGIRARSRQAFVSAAEQLAADGAAYADLSVARIAECAGYSRASFYAHFPDKLALATAVGQQLTEALETVAGAWLAGTDERSIAAILDAVASTFVAHRGAVLLITEAAAYDPDVRELHARLVARFERSVATRLHDDARDISDAHAVAFILVWSTQAVLAEILRRSGQPPEPATLAALVAQWEAAFTGGR